MRAGPLNPCMIFSRQPFFKVAVGGSIRRHPNREALKTMQIAITEPAEDARQAAETARSSMARLLAVAGHDLRQPLQVALMSVARAVEDGVSPGAAKRLAFALDAMMRLGSELDDIARLSQRDVALRPQRRVLPIDDVLSDVERDWRVYAEARGTRLEIRSTRARIETDPAMLKCILRNLVGNAIRHGGRGGRVVVSCRRQDGLLVIDVADDGAGIPVAHLSRIFDAFERCGAADGEEGLGLGLTIVKQTAEMLGHPIAIRSIENEGTVFSIAVPLAGSPHAMLP